MLQLFYFIPFQVLSDYKRRGSEMLMEVFESSDNLEEISGIAQLKTPSLEESDDDVLVSPL